MQGAVIKYLRSLPPETNWNEVKAALRQQFSLVPTVTHVAVRLMNQYQQRDESLRDFDFGFSDLIQVYILL